jgi:PAS domain S-box-containing protein
MGDRDVRDFLAGGGDMAARMAAHDWSSTLGALETWPQSLKTAVSLLVHSPIPIVLLWGPDGIMLYNDAYSVFAGNRHPQLLGSKVLEGWPEAADLNSLVMQTCMAGGTLSFKDRELSLNRTGTFQKLWVDLGYSPVMGESGQPAGVIAIVVETTERVLAERAVAADREKLAQMFRDAPSFMAQLDGPSHVFTFTNQAYQQLIGHRDVIGKPVRGALPEIAGQGFYELLDDLYASGENFRSYGVPVKLQREPGAPLEDRLLDFIYQPVRDSEGKITGIFVQGNDVTDALQGQRLRAALVDISDAIRDIPDPDELAFTAAQILGRTFAVSRAGYGTIDKRNETITIERDWNAPGIKSLAGVLRFRDYGSYIDDLKRGETVICTDAFTDPRTAATASALKAISAQSFINMPVTEQGDFVALLYLNHENAREWTPEEVVFVREVADRIRTAVERRRAESDLKSSEALFSTMAQAVPNHVWMAKADGTLDWFNEPVYAYSGMARGSLDGNGWTAMVHGDDLAGAAAQWAAALASGTIYESEFRLRRADGAWRWHLARAVPIKDAAGQVTRWVGTNTDIHDQKEVAEALEDLNATLEQRVEERTARLAHSEAQLRSIADSTHIHQGLLDLEGRVESANAIALAAIDSDAVDVLGKFFWETPWFAATPLMHDKVRAAVAKVAGDDSVRMEMTLDLPTGNRWFDFAMRPLWDEKDQVIGLVWEAADITERRVAEEALRQAQKMEAVGQLTGGIAHDFNNLLQGITGALDRVQYRISEGRIGDVDRFLKAAIESANRASSLTHRLLAFSRRQTLDPRAVDANRLIAGLEDMIRRTMGPNVRVDVVGAGGLWPVRVDASQLENSLLNLCINARDAMPEGGVLTIETANKWLDERAAKERELPSGQYVSLCVTDSGTGMTPEVIARAFDPFFTTKPLGQGTGLGLSMIYGFVRQSGGQVRVYSEIGKGTTMCLYFPRHMGAVETDAPHGDEAVERGFGETVLVVDDEPTVRMLIAEVLGENFYNIVEAGDGPSALKLLQSGQRIDLMVTDVGLPGGMNGRQVADAARVARPHLKVLFITGYAENAAVGNGHLDAGMEILAKPFAMSTLANKVREMIES